MRYNILIVEDHLVVKDGLKVILDAEELLKVVGDLDNGNDVIPFMEKEPVDLVLLDINLPGINGIEITKSIKQQFPETKVLALTFYNKAAFIKKSIEAEVDGYLLKNSSREEVITAIFKVLNGETYFSREATDTLMNSFKRQNRTHVAKLTKREEEVMILLARAYTVNEVADKLFISAHTAETHRKNIMAKLRFKNKAELTLYAKENGYLDLP